MFLNLIQSNIACKPVTPEFARLGITKVFPYYNNNSMALLWNSQGAKLSYLQSQLVVMKQN